MITHAWIAVGLNFHDEGWYAFLVRRMYNGDGFCDGGRIHVRLLCVNVEAQYHLKGATARNVAEGGSV